MSLGKESVPKVKMITVLASKKNQTWDSFAKLLLDSSVVHLTYCILCFQCSAVPLITACTKID